MDNPGDLAIGPVEAAAIMGVNRAYPDRCAEKGILLRRVLINAQKEGRERTYTIFSLHDCEANLHEYRTNPPPQHHPRQHLAKREPMLAAITDRNTPRILFGDAISLVEAARIMGMVPSRVPRMCKEGNLLGRQLHEFKDGIVASRYWIVSRMDCLRNREEYIRRRRQGTMRGRPRKQLDALINIPGQTPSKEGRFITHKARERNSDLRKRKRKVVLDTLGSLRCEVCEFDFVDFYGKRGRGFAECHHRDPLGTLPLGEERYSTVDDLAIVCANCHRMIHKTPWLTVEELRAELVARGSIRNQR